MQYSTMYEIKLFIETKLPMTIEDIDALLDLLRDEEDIREVIATIKARNEVK
jgi:DNA repair photolyase